MLHALIAAAALSSAPLDSQAVLERYASRLLSTELPKTLVFTYSVSQAGPQTLEQTHRVYRSGDLVRDETLQIDGQTLKTKVTRIARYRDRYTLETLAPRMTEYAFLFLRSVRSGSAYSYEYKAVPIGATGAFAVDGITIDGRTFLPSEIRFRTHSGTIRGAGAISFGRSGKYWVPSTVTVQAAIAGKSARERITFTSYQFPRSLPKSTFQSPRPLPTPVLPAF
ncbi:MAG TPA: hypothetical protein VJP85_02705 [Candidatus Baltobacteraceae bacterium]|nr:hypothetical protein [Candidatus Baltobacteraceae bacterium]